MPGLILVPTDTERQSIQNAIRIDADRWSIETIGFGVIASAVSTTRLLSRAEPAQVILAGIAGLFQGPQTASLQIGDAIWFDSVCVDGIGVGQGDAFIDAMDMGWDWHQGHSLKAPLYCPHLQDASVPELDPPLLLTVCSSSAGPEDAKRRMERFPSVIGEDMEGFSVAHACRLAGVPLGIIRGFSNAVGQRDKSQWQIGKALSSVSRLLQRHMDEPDR